MKKILALLGAFSLLITSTACNENERTAPSEKTNAVQTAPLFSYKTADIQMADDFSEIISLDKRSNYILIFGKLHSGIYSGYITNPQFSEKKAFKFTPQEGETVKSAAVMRTGKAAVMTCLDGDTLLYVLSENGSIEKTLNCGEVIDPDSYISLIASDDGFFFSSDSDKMYFVSSGGEYVEHIVTGDRTICGFANDSEGQPAVLFCENEKQYYVTLVDGQLGEETFCGELGSNVHGFGSGCGEYSASAVFPDGLYVLKGAEWQKRSDLSDNDFNSYNIIACTMLAENEFAVIISTNSGGYEMRLLTERDISEVKSRSVLTMSLVIGKGSDIIDERLKKFNSESDSYKVELVNYGNTSDDMSQCFDALRRDIIAGNAPDIIKFDSNIPVNTFGSREGMFVDLYTLIDNDKDISRDDFLDGFLEGYETNGKLLMFDTEFTVSTVSVKEKFLNGLTSWNYEQLGDVYRNMPEDMFFSSEAASQTRSDVFMSFINYGEFVDYDNAACNFDSPEFIKAMKFIGENEIGLTEEEYLNGEMQYSGNYYAEIHRADKALALTFEPVNGFYGFREIEQGYMGEPTAFIGYPTENGCGNYRRINGGYGIMANSDNIEGAWEFLKYYLFDESKDPRFYFSGLEKNFEEQAAESVEEYIEVDPETGKEYSGEIFVWHDNGGMHFENGASPELHKTDIHPLTEEQQTEYEALVREAVKNVCIVDSTLISILREELVCYFEGERSAEETAEIIQNRVSIYISEQYS
ncbi:MAG: extracellular solute-binding protein [Ruminococcus sp.]|nr:extracellular solute-binding protein [Ruminococcus sp.]